MFRTLLILILSINLYADIHVEKVSLQLLWKHQFEFSGFYIAKEKGFYKQVGLDLDIKEFNFGTDIISDVANGKTTFGLSYPTVILEKSKSKDIILLKSILQSSPHILVSLESSGIKSIKEFKGKKVMMNSNAAESASFISMLKSQDISLNDLNIINHSFKIDDLIDGKTDIMSCFASNELYTLDKRGIKYRVWDPKEFGFDFYEDILFTSNNFLKNNPKVVDRFIEATLKGWEYAFKHTDETVELILSKYNTQNKSKDALLYEANTLRNLAFASKNIGDIDKNKVRRIIDIYLLMGLKKDVINLDEFIYDYEVNKMNLTLEELEYLDNNNILKVCTNPDWEPIEFFDKESLKPSGISIDTLELVAKKLNNKIGFRFIKTNSWEESQKFLEEKKCDILPSAQKNQKREKYASFTDSYLDYKLAIITQRDKPFVRDIEDILDNTIARNKSSGLIDILKKTYPNIKIVETKDYLDSFYRVSKGSVDCTIATLPTTSYFINKYSINNLQVAGYIDIAYKLSIAVRDDNPMLLSILNKALNQITNKEQKEIYDNWATVKLVETTDYSLYLKIIGVILLITIFLIYKQYMLKKSFNDMSEIIDTTFEGIMIIKDENLIDVNSSFVEMLGYSSKKEVLDCYYLDFVAKDSRKLFLENISLDTKEPHEVILVKKDGTKFDTLHRSYYLQNKGIRILSLIDISQLKRVESQSKLISMGEMIGNIAHQWRQPLNVISISASGMKLQKELDLLDDKTFIKFTDAILTSTTYLSDTIETFRNFIRDDKVIQNVILQDRIDSALEITSTTLKNNEIKLINNIDYTEPFEIEIIVGELSQVIINIINNAKDILVQKDIKNPWIKISLRKFDNKIQILIEDNGGGIPEKILPRIFEPYFTTKHQSQGTGIGLHMSYKIVTQSLKGKLFVENTEVGARFYIELPFKNSK